MKVVPFYCDEVKCDIKTVTGKCPEYPTPPEQQCKYVEPIKHCSDLCVKPLDAKSLLNYLKNAKLYPEKLDFGVSRYLNECMVTSNNTRLFFAPDANLYLIDSSNKVLWQTNFIKPDGRYSFSSFGTGIGLYEKLKDNKEPSPYFIFKPNVKDVALNEQLFLTIDTKNDIKMFTKAKNMLVYSLKGIA